jgi:hypothetical protein
MGGGSTSSSWSGSYNTSRSASVTRRSARSYADADRRTYSAARHGKSPIERAVLDIESESELPIVLMLDVTGSMKKWPELILEKLPVWYAESNFTVQGLTPDEVEKRKKNGQSIDDKIELSIVAVGDVEHDRYPLQVTDFKKSGQLVKAINSIYPEGGGGGNAKESYELAAYYLLNHCKTPKVLPGMKPLLIVAGDEGFYAHVKKDEVKQLIGDETEGSPHSRDVWKELAKKFDVYVLRPETGSYDASTYKAIHEQWAGAFGAQRVMKMHEPNRIVDCMIGIAAYASSQLEQGRAWLERRQSEEQVKEVLEALHPLVGGKR